MEWVVLYAKNDFSISEGSVFYTWFEFGGFQFTKPLFNSNSSNDFNSTLFCKTLGTFAEPFVSYQYVISFFSHFSPWIAYRFLLKLLFSSAPNLSGTPQRGLFIALPNTNQHMSSPFCYFLIIAHIQNHLNHKSNNTQKYKTM